MQYGLFQEREGRYDGRFLCFAFADGEEADDVDDQHNDGGKTYSNPAENGDQCADNGNQGDEDLNFQSLTYMESYVRRGSGSEKGNDNTDPAHQIRNHCQNLVLRNVSRAEFCSVVGGGRSSILHVYIGQGIAAFRAVDSCIVKGKMTLGTNFHGNTSVSFVTLLLYHMKDKMATDFGQILLKITENGRGQSRIRE